MLKKNGSTAPRVDACMLFLEMLINKINNVSTSKQKYSYEGILKILVDSKNKLDKDSTLKRKMLLFDTFYNISNLRGGII